MAQTSDFYQTTKNVPFAAQLSIRARKDLFQKFMETMQPSPNATLLDVGVTCDQVHGESNFFEAWYPQKQQITCVGVEDASYLEIKYPGVKFKRIQPGEPLPFDDKQFDIVFSNAVLEHVGDRKSQKFFVSELCRVGKRVFLAVPNRFFPVEHHTAIPLLHYFPNRVFRALASSLGFKFWANENNLNLFYPWTISEFFPKDRPAKLVFSGPGIGPLRSNVLAYTQEANV